jgi:glyoxylase-like metal-dependent hydrolase (beta-lactamase superfamily II)
VVKRVVRVLAPNPSPMTLEGTNSYVILGGTQAIAIDPGPNDPEHLDAIVTAAAQHGATITAIAVTHGHPDHAPGAAPLHARTGAPVYAHALARFPHDVTSAEGDRIVAGEAVLRVMEAPGHAREHLIFAFDDDLSIFTGDVIVGRGTIVIAPPGGDMRDYQATLARLRVECAPMRVIYGGHGLPIDDPVAKVDEYIAHRRRREREILELLASGERTIPELVAAIYWDVSKALWPAAARQVLAYLIALERERRVWVRTLDRALTSEEAEILNPDLSAIVDPGSAAVARAELGFDRTVDTIDSYGLTP